MGLAAAARWDFLGGRLAAIALLALAALLPACERTSPSALKSSHPSRASGADAVVASSAHPRIIVLSPALAIILRDMGLEPAIVGRHAWDLVLDPALPVCGDQAGIDFESVLALNPSHVVVQWGARELPERLVSLAKDRGWKVLDLNPLALDDVPKVARELEKEFEPAITAGGSRERVATLLGDLDAACATRDEVGFEGRVLLLGAAAPPAALGPGSWHHDLFVRMGGHQALTAGGAYQRLDAEDLLRLAPDGVILIDPRDRKAPQPAMINRLADLGPAGSKRLGTLENLRIPALTAGNLGIVDDPLALTPSSAIVGVRRRLREIVAAWEASAGVTDAGPSPSVPPTPK